MGSSLKFTNLGYGGQRLTSFTHAVKKTMKNNKQVHFYLSDVAYEALTQKATDYGMTVSQYMRSLAQESIRPLDGALAWHRQKAESLGIPFGQYLTQALAIAQIVHEEANNEL